MVFCALQKKTRLPTLHIDGSELGCVEEFNFLGITIDKYLNWKSHVNKLSKSIGIMNKLKNILPQNIMLAIYNSHILSHINFAKLAWGYQFDRIYKLKKAIRAITRSKYNTHSEPIFKELDLLKIDDIYKIQHLKFFYKYVNNNLPECFQAMSFIYHSEIHSHHTRHRNNFVISRTNYEYTKRSIRINLVYILNDTPNIIQDKCCTHSLHGFFIYAKQNNLNKYETYCHIPNCYVCKLQNQD